MSDTNSRSAVLSRTQILTLYLPAMVLALGTGLAAPALPIIAKNFDVTFGVAALVVIVFQGGALVATLPAGYLMDRLGRRPLLIAGPLITGVATLGVAFASSYPELLAYRFLAGAASQIWMQSRLAMIADSAQTQHRARQVTWMVGMERAGQLAGPAVGGVLAQAFGLQAPFIVHGLMTLLVIVPSLILTTETLSRTSQRGSKIQASDGSWRELWAAICTVQIAAFLCVQFLASYTRGSTDVGTTNLYAAYAYGIGPQDLGLLATASGAVAMPIPFMTGHFMDRYGRKSVVALGFFLIGCTTLFMTFIAWAQLPLLIFGISLAMMQGALSVSSGTMQVLVTDLAPANSRGRFLGVARLIAQFGGLSSPTVFALLADHVGYPASFFNLSISAFMLVFIVLVFITETLKREPAPAAAAPTA